MTYSRNFHPPLQHWLRFRHVSNLVPSHISSRSRIQIFWFSKFCLVFVNQHLTILSLRNLVTNSHQNLKFKLGHSHWLLKTSVFSQTFLKEKINEKKTCKSCNNNSFFLPVISAPLISSSSIRSVSCGDTHFPKRHSFNSFFSISNSFFLKKKCVWIDSKPLINFFFIQAKDRDKS